MPEPSHPKQQITRTRENNDPAAFSSKPMLDEHDQLHDRKDTPQGVVRDERGQNQPADRTRAQQTSSRKQHGDTDPPLHPRPKE